MPYNVYLSTLYTSIGLYIVVTRGVASSSSQTSHASAYIAIPLINGNTAGNTFVPIYNTNIPERVGPVGPPGGYLNPYYTLFTNSDPKEALNSLQSFCRDSGIDCERGNDYQLRCYHYN